MPYTPRQQENTGFRKRDLFRCATRPNISGVPLRLKRRYIACIVSSRLTSDNAVALAGVLGVLSIRHTRHEERLQREVDVVVAAAQIVRPVVPALCVLLSLWKENINGTVNTAVR